MYKYFKEIDNTDNILQWKSKGKSDKVIKTPDNMLAPELIHSGKKIRVKFICLKQDKITFYHGKIVNIYIV